MDNNFDPDGSMWDWLTHDLRFLCEKHGLTYSALGRLLNRSPSNMSNIMAGRRHIANKDAKIIDTKYNTGGHYVRLLGWARRGHSPDWFQDYYDLEAESSMVKTFDGLVIPGLLQTPEYAAELFRASGAANIDSLVKERMSRQKIFDKANPPVLWALVTESVIDWPVGATDAMQKQLAHLLDMSTRANIGLRVVERGAGAHLGMDGGFRLISGGFGAVVYTESPGGGRLVQSDTEVRSYALRHDRIGHAASSAKASREVIRRVMEAL